MEDFAILYDWLTFAVRWLHVITAIAWIGSSFYFIALDLGLRQPPGLPLGVQGEEWQVHGGGFYHIRKYLVAPPEMPEHLIWFKWESYATWLSGAALLVLIYWVGGHLYLIEPSRADLALWQAIGISALSLIIGWVIYDAMCKSPLGDSPTLLMCLLFLMLIGMSWGYHQVFSGRAAMLHLGAFTATIMTANVAMIIIPNQRVVVADLRAGQVPDAKYGKIAKLRSTHNNYLTLPVIYLMLSNHYPLSFATPYAWATAPLVFLMGVTIRHYFNTRHAGKGNPTWTWVVTVILFLCVAWLSSMGQAETIEDAESRSLTHVEQKFASAAGFEDAESAVLGRCSMCHAREPVWTGIHVAPKAVYLETTGDIAGRAREIYLQAGVSHAMPPANVTEISAEERAAIRAWYQGAL